MKLLLNASLAFAMALALQAQEGPQPKPEGPKREGAPRRAIQIESKTVRTTGANPYDVEAMILPRPNGQYVIDVNITQTTQRDGKAEKRNVARPRITTSLGVPASLTSGSDADAENVTLNVDMPKEAEGKAVGKVIIKRGDKVLGEAKFQLPLTPSSGKGS